MHCGVLLRSVSEPALLAEVCEHGEHTHGYTPAWYSPERLAAMAKLVRER